MKKKIVFICSGNTCRSPIAEAIFNALAKNLDAAAVSCGLYAALPQPASPGARKTVKKYGADLSGHMSRPVTEDLLKDACAIYCMTSAHAETVRSFFPAISDIVYMLDDVDISDPFGGSDEKYERTAEQIYKCIVRILKSFEGNGDGNRSDDQA